MSSGGSTSQPNVDVDRIVREVMAQLNGRRQSEPPARAADQPQPVRRSPDKPSPVSRELRLAGRVITAADVVDRLDGVARIVVGRNAVLTPAARDLIREKRIETSIVDGQSAGLGGRLVLAMAETNYQPAALEAVLRQQGTQIEHLAHTGLSSVVDEMCDLVAKGGQLGLLLTSAGAAAICLANRRRGVRAALGVDAAGVAAAVRGVGANLLVVDPAGRNLYQLKQMAAEFLTGPARTCPAQYAERLN